MDIFIGYRRPEKRLRNVDEANGKVSLRVALKNIKRSFTSSFNMPTCRRFILRRKYDRAFKQRPRLNILLREEKKKREREDTHRAN